MFPKNEKHRFSVSDIFSTLLQPCFFQWSKAVCVNFRRPSHRLATLHFSFCVADKPSYPYAGLAECARRVSIIDSCGNGKPDTW